MSTNASSFATKQERERLPREMSWSSTGPSTAVCCRRTLPPTTSWSARFDELPGEPERPRSGGGRQRPRGAPLLFATNGTVGVDGDIRRHDGSTQRDDGLDQCDSLYGVEYARRRRLRLLDGCRAPGADRRFRHGSYVVPDRYNNSIVDRLRAKSVGLQSGFTILETAGDTLHVPKVTGRCRGDVDLRGERDQAGRPDLLGGHRGAAQARGLTVVINELIAD